jgi:hypothetical protein
VVVPCTPSVVPEETVGIPETPTVEPLLPVVNPATVEEVVPKNKKISIFHSSFNAHDVLTATLTCR